VAAAVLLRRGAVASIDEAEAFMQRARPGVHINSAQRRVLEGLGYG
jgi:protein-tyrosine phosphatase